MLKKIIVFMFIVLLFNSCQTAQFRNTVAITNFGKTKGSQKCVIVPWVFTDRASWITEDVKKRYPMEVQTIFEAEFLTLGYEIVEREQVKHLLEEAEFQMSGLTTNQGVQIGKMASADTVVFGTLYIWKYFQGKVHFSSGIKAVDVKTSRVLWNIRAIGVEKTERSSYSFDLLASKTLRNAIGQLKEKLNN